MNIVYNQLDIGGAIVKDNETYVLRDNKTLNNLVLSSTHLHVGQRTRGHSHTGQEEVYFFVSGSGQMTVGTQEFIVVPGSVVLIPDGLFHQVTNTGTGDLVFNCVFDGKRNH